MPALATAAASKGRATKVTPAVAAAALAALGSNTVTSHPAARAAAAASSPIQPAPTTAIRPPFAKAALSRSLSSMVRRYAVGTPLSSARAGPNPTVALL